MIDQRITRDEYGLDEIFLCNVDIHVERMDEGCIWIGVYVHGESEDIGRLSVFLQAAYIGATPTIAGIIAEDDFPGVKATEKEE